MAGSSRRAPLLEFAEIPESADPLRVLKYFRGLFAYQNL
jgi:hypothetical protein